MTSPVFLWLCSIALAFMQIHAFPTEPPPLYPFVRMGRPFPGPFIGGRAPPPPPPGGVVSFPLVPQAAVVTTSAPVITTGPPVVGPTPGDGWAGEDVGEPRERTDMLPGFLSMLFPYNNRPIEGPSVAPGTGSSNPAAGILGLMNPSMTRPEMVGQGLMGAGMMGDGMMGFFGSMNGMAAEYAALNAELNAEIAALNLGGAK